MNHFRNINTVVKEQVSNILFLPIVLGCVMAEDDTCIGRYNIKVLKTHLLKSNAFKGIEAYQQ